jgi:hypothetical protein
MAQISISEMTPPILTETLSCEEVESVVGGGWGKGGYGGGYYCGYGYGYGGGDDDDLIFFSRGPGNSRELFFFDENGNGGHDDDELFFSRGPGNSRELFFFG